MNEEVRDVVLRAIRETTSGGEFAYLKEAVKISFGDKPNTKIIMFMLRHAFPSTVSTALSSQKFEEIDKRLIELEKLAGLR